VLWEPFYVCFVFWWDTQFFKKSIAVSKDILFEHWLPGGFARQVSAYRAQAHGRVVDQCDKLHSNYIPTYTHTHTHTFINIHKTFKYLNRKRSILIFHLKRYLKFQEFHRNIHSEMDFHFEHGSPLTYSPSEELTENLRQFFGDETGHEPLLSQTGPLLIHIFPFDELAAILRQFFDVKLHFWPDFTTKFLKFQVLLQRENWPRVANYFHESNIFWIC